MIDALLEQMKQWFMQLNVQGWAYANLVGQDRWETSWTPARTGWTDVGTPTVTGRFRIVGRKCEFQQRVVPGTTVATTAGTSYTNLPVAATGLAGSVTMFNATTNVAVGVGGIDVTNSRCYVPTQAASGNTFLISGWIEV